MSPELAKFLAAEGDQGDTPSLDPAQSLTHIPSLDITTSHFRLEGVDQELEQFRNHEVWWCCQYPALLLADGALFPTVLHTQCCIKKYTCKRSIPITPNPAARYSKPSLTRAVTPRSMAGNTNPNSAKQNSTAYKTTYPRQTTWCSFMSRYVHVMAFWRPWRNCWVSFNPTWEAFRVKFDPCRSTVRA